MIKPSEVCVSETCLCIGTLGRVELESVAACIVLFHREKSPDEWISFSRMQIADWIPTSALLATVVSNPFWKLDVKRFVAEGYIQFEDETDINSMGVLQPKFFEALNRAIEIPKLTPRDYD